MNTRYSRYTEAQYCKCGFVSTSKFDGPCMFTGYTVYGVCPDCGGNVNDVVGRFRFDDDANGVTRDGVFEFLRYLDEQQ